MPSNHLVFVVCFSSCEELTHWKRLWCWEGLGAGGEGDNRGLDCWLASPTRWMWVWVNSGSWWWQGGLACCDSWGRKESYRSELLSWGQYPGCDAFSEMIREISKWRNESEYQVFSVCWKSVDFKTFHNFKYIVSLVPKLLLGCFCTFFFSNL